MLVVYSSKTGNTELFLKKVEVKNYLKIIKNKNQNISENFILITYTTGLGEIPEEVESFLKYKNNSSFLTGVIASGNRNFGNLFAKAADLISDKYNIPILMKYELTGNKNDVLKLKEYLKILNT